MITFLDTSELMDVNILDALLDTELAADSALREAGVGMIEGNEIGQHQYDLYFVGYDRAHMWQILESIFDAAPVAWSIAELRDGLEDPTPVVLRPNG